MTDLVRRNLEIADLYESGLSMRAVGARFEICCERVRQILAKMGVKSRGRVDERALAAAVAIYERGGTIKDAARKSGAKAGTLRLRLQDLEIPVRPPYRYDEKIRQRAVRLYESGRSIPRVAERLGCSKHAVLVWLRRSGTAIRKAGCPPPDESIRRRAVRRVRRGETIADVADSIGVCKSTVGYWIRPRPRSRNGHRHRYDRKAKREAVASVRAGRPVPAVALDLGASPDTVRRWMRQGW